ncbi:MAG: MFS transporter [Dehalococcoidales bacterium]|nr:MFS transporter [Dehalococcoidales bacterium]MDP6576319.1 MFS transporter [Dehalococcoidales bacterium]MDP6824581.1 MFS transporter [Dehalococcoidales bacterium]
MNSNEIQNGTGQFHRINYVKITILGFALAALWSSLHSIILPLRLLDFVAESQKNTYLGLLTFTGLLLAMIIQPVAGTISDRSTFHWGRRRPYILLGTAVALLFLPGIGFAWDYAAIFIIYCLLQISANTTQGPYQAFIPDLVPEGKRGLASGMKGLLEIVGGIALIYPIALFMDRYFAGEGSIWLWTVLVMLAIVLLGAMVATVLTVKEQPVSGKPQPPLLTTFYQTFNTDVRQNRNFIWFLISRLLVFMAFTTIQQFALNFLQDVIGVTNPAEATARFSIVAVTGMLAVVYLTGYFSDKIGRKPIAVTAALLGAIGIAILFMYQSYGAMLVAAGIIGIALGAFNSTNWALATDLITKGEEARYLGLANMATAGGAALARLIGLVIDFFNNYTPNLGYQVMLGACFVYFVAGSTLLLKIKKVK